MSEQLNDFIASQHEVNLQNANTLGRIEQALLDTNKRLFGGDGQLGVLPIIHGRIEDLEKKDLKELNTRLSGLETWKDGTLKWVAGAVAVLVLEGTALGFYFNHVASVVKNTVGALPR